jgi:hypothetical protein
MAIRTKEELRNYIYNNIKPNNNNEITGQIVQTTLIDLVDSFVIAQFPATGTINVSQTSSNLMPDDTNLFIPIIDTPKYGVSVIVNGESFQVGDNNNNSPFYFLDGFGNVRNLGEIQAFDILHYNSTELGYTIDNLDKITLTYLIEI